MLRLFRPILAGATFSDRLVACLGATLGIGFVALACLGRLPLGMPEMVAPIGASAVLVFAVPASPLAQPWPVLGGNVVGALVGVAFAQALGTGPLAAGLAVGAAILVMSLARCLHPPGGAAALVAVIGGPAVVDAGWLFPFVPVGLNSALLVAAAWGFHRFSGHSYPHRVAPAQPQPAFLPEDLDRALEAEHETFDIAREDLERLLARVEAEAAARRLRPTRR
ncbi:HPP family protein [Sphingomonas lenta]|uniref:HPP family protein n=1 Tax=Sphingomonas lenta TaxID=1141887 RepID=A0A2A2SGI2_9SPHN|nr:HPP family protein [Sphingomonas lenta]PAX08313.1 HPP family protein [Sphingomonas lenta]